MPDVVYRLLGLTAKVNGRLWLTRINFIPVNISLMAALAFGTYLGIVEIQERLRTDHTENLALAVGLTAAAAITLLLFVVASVNRNVIFREGRYVIAGLAGGSDPRYSITGRLQLNDSTSQRFTNMPAVLTTLETRETAIVSNIDASSRFFGVKTSDRSGLWMAVIQSGTISDIRHGHLFFGLRQLPALKFRYRSTLTNADEVAILASLSGDDPSVALLGVRA